MVITVQGKTSVVGIIGDPVRHSLSPVMHNAAFAECNLDFVYVPFAVSPGNLEQAVAGLRALGVCGFNVTIPHKSSIIPFLDSLDESAERAGAVNTVKVCGSSLVGYNTDGDGLVASLEHDLGFIPSNEQILVLGAGGASRGALAALCRSGARRILLCNRSRSNAYAVKQIMTDHFPQTSIDVITFDQLNENHISVSSLLINTTSLGMHGERIDHINLAHLPKHAGVYDMVYSTNTTPLINDARILGLRSANGLGMLVAQGERAFEIWTGVMPPEGVMRKALNGI